MKREVLAYMAGIVDGEGSIRIELQKGQKRGLPDYYRLRVSVSNTDIGLMQWLVSTIGYSYLKEKKRVGNRKQNYQWEIKSPVKVALFIKQLLPYLIVKRGRAEVALQLAKMMKGRGHRFTGQERLQIRALYERMRRLNNRGRIEPV